jgi:hypothetical protein
VVYSSASVNALQAFAEPIPDAVPLTSREKERLAELEKVVETGLQEFLRTGAALAEIRNARLYRTHYSTFQEYVRCRFGLKRTALDTMIRASSVAQSLLDAGEVLPPTTKPTVIRPIAALPSTELQTACWSLVRAVSPARDPTQPLVSKVCRLVRNCLEDAGENGDSEDCSGRTHSGGYQRRRQREPTGRELAFSAPVIRLGTWSGFNAEVIISHIDQAQNARTLYKACAVVAQRCQAVQQQLAIHFPALQTEGVQ